MRNNQDLRDFNPKRQSSSQIFIAIIAALIGLVAAAKMAEIGASGVLFIPIGVIPLMLVLMARNLRPATSEENSGQRVIFTKQWAGQLAAWILAALITLKWNEIVTVLARRNAWSDKIEIPIFLVGTACIVAITYMGWRWLSRKLWR